MAFEVELAEEIWTAKYQFESDVEGDATFEETAARVAKEVATARSTPTPDS